jgi:predicted adenylyl cyclase CyaB
MLDNTAELIWYSRPDQQGPKQSIYHKETVIPSKEMLAILDLSCGLIGSVRKTRLLYILGQTRLHIDEVKDLGNFMELEVVLEDEQTLEEGEKIAKEIMEDLGIKNEDLIDKAYIDLIRAKNARKLQVIADTF